MHTFITTALIFLIPIFIVIIAIGLLRKIVKFLDNRYTPKEIRTRRPKLITALAVLSLLGAINLLIMAKPYFSIRNQKERLNWQETLVREGEVEHKGKLHRWEDYSPERKARTFWSIRSIKAQIKYRPLVTLNYSLHIFLGIVLFIGFLHLKAWLLKTYIFSVAIRFILAIPAFIWSFPKEPELLPFRLAYICAGIVSWGVQILIIRYLMKPRVRQLYQPTQAYHTQQ